MGTLCASLCLKKMIALFYDGKLQPRAARRLSLHDSNITDATKSEFDLTLVRSLIVIGQAGKAILVSVAESLGS